LSKAQLTAVLIFCVLLSSVPWSNRISRASQPWCGCQCQL